MTNDYTVATGASTTVNGSGYQMTVYPGQVDPGQCYTDLTGSPTQTAAVAFTYKIQFIDLWGNVHYQTMNDDIAAGMTVEVVADYENHDNWPSPIGVDDDPSW